MSVNNWFGSKKAWELSIPNKELKTLMVASRSRKEGKNRFKLKPKKDTNGKVIYFTVDFKDGALPARWKKVTLFPRGNKRADPQPAPALPAKPESQDPLDPQNVAYFKLAQTAVNSVKTYLDNHSSTTERLEGEIDVNGERATLTLIQIPKVANGSALLCVCTTFDGARPGGMPNPDGTGGGTSVRT